MTGETRARLSKTCLPNPGVVDQKYFRVGGIHVIRPSSILIVRTVLGSRGDRKLRNEDCAQTIGSVGEPTVAAD